METISARARLELRKLLAGEELSVGDCKVALRDEGLAVHVLAELVERYQSGKTGASREDAEQLLEAVGQSAQDGRDPASLEAQQPVADETGGDTPEWRLHRLTAHNYRGLTEWEGQTFEWDFMGKPHHIYGPNGSGKTAILSAVVWCLTGSCLRERAEPESEIRQVDLYSDEACTRRIEGGWPEVVTVPHTVGPTQLAQANPHCWVEVEMESPGRHLGVRRSLEGHGTEPELEIRENNVSYGSLSEVGISDMDSELTMLMPGRVSALQFAPGSKFSDNVLSVSGLGDLRNIAELARRLGATIKKRSNEWRDTAQGALDNAAKIARLTALPDLPQHELKQVLQDAESGCERASGESDPAYHRRLYERQSRAILQKADDEFSAIETAIAAEPPEPEEAQVLSVDQRRKIADGLAKARHLIEEREPCAWEPLATWLSLETDIGPALDSVEAQAQTVGRSVAGRYEVWHRNIQAAGKLDVKIRAAQYLQGVGRFEECPVCEQDLPEAMRVELKGLASKTAADTESLRLAVQEGVTQMSGKVPADLRKLQPASPLDQARTMLQNRVTRHMAGLGQLQQAAADRVADALDDLPDYAFTEPPARFVLDHWDEKFRNELVPLQEEYERVLQLCAVGRWAKEHAAQALDEIAKAVRELTDQLATLEKYGRRYGVLMEAAGQLEKAARKCHEAETQLKRAEEADRVHGMLSDLTKLDQYSKLSLEADICDIALTMQEIYCLLYPNDYVRLAALVNRATKKGAKPDYRCILRWSDELFADADTIANAGRIRGLLWSYTFGLIERHASSLQVVAVDDPYISLDDYAAQNMVTDVLVKRLGGQHQVLSTVHDRNLVSPVWVRGPAQERFGVTRVLLRGPLHRYCRVAPGLEPLQKAIVDRQEDPDRYKAVVRETRAYLERSLKLVAEYVLTGNRAKDDFPTLVNDLSAAAQGGKGTTPLGSRVRQPLQRLLQTLGVDFSKSPPTTPKDAVILHALHHGGPDESLATPAHAIYVENAYPCWAEGFERMFDEIDAVLARSQTTATVQADALPTLEHLDLPLTTAHLDSPALEIGRVAAEGIVSIDELDKGRPTEHTWPDLCFAIVATDVCAPVVLPGQAAIFAPSCAVKDGDLALMATAAGCRLRRVFRVPLGGEEEPGWVGQSVNPLVRDVAPAVARDQDIVLKKLVGVLYTSDVGHNLAAVPSSTDVATVQTPWPRMLTELNAGKARLIRVSGDSAEPVALHGQYLIVADTTPEEVKDNSLCCLRLSNGTMIVKRLARSESDANRVLLQPINQLAGYRIIEALLSVAAEDDEAPASSMPHVEDIQVVCGVLFAEPEMLDG